jgi:hypothetical protein
MPLFNAYIDTNIDVDIEIDDFLIACSDDDISNIIKYLQEEGHLPNGKHEIDSSNYQVNQAIKKIVMSSHNLTPEQEKILIELGDQLILYPV